MSNRNRGQSGIGLIVAVLLMGVAGCGPGAVKEEAVVADVGEREIAMREITDYITSLMIDYPTPADEYQARRHRLKTLIEDELFIIGGYARALDADIGILEMVEKEKDKFLLDELYRVEVLDKVDVSEGEIRAAYARVFDRVRLLHILVESQAVGDTVMAALRSGGDFADLAQEHSLDEASRLRGGDLGRFFGWGELPLEMETAAFDAPVDEIIGPIATPYGWHIIKVLEKKQEPKRDYETMSAGLENRIRRRKQDEQRVEHLDSLRVRYSIRFDTATVALWQAKRNAIADTAELRPDQTPIVPATDLSDDERSRALYRFGTDNIVTLGQFCENLSRRSPLDQPDPEIPESMEMFAFGNSLFDILHAEALRLGLDESETYRDRVREYQESLMADQMRQHVLVRGVSVTEDETAAFFQAHRDSLAQPAQYHVRELMVYDSAAAEDLMRQVNEGASFERLTRQRTERSGMADKGGDLGWLFPWTYPDYYNLATEMTVGQVYGPIIASGQYSLIELLGVRPPQPRELDEVRGVIFERLQKEKQTAVTARYVDSVQVHHPVQVHHDVLESGLGNVSTVADSLGRDWRQM
ncbi:MAG TPA: peptidylprolyl isomerase [Acidobacteriota bacterium]|nr:peptidylprolyl isomerase [Acidobacteriota bacterium]